MVTRPSRGENTGDLPVHHRDPGYRVEGHVHKENIKTNNTGSISLHVQLLHILYVVTELTEFRTVLAI